MFPSFLDDAFTQYPELLAHLLTLCVSKNWLCSFWYEPEREMHKCLIWEDYSENKQLAETSSKSPVLGLLMAYVEALSATTDKSQPTFKTGWSDENNKFVGLCNQYPSLSFLVDTEEKALAGIKELVAFVANDLKAH